MIFITIKDYVKEALKKLHEGYDIDTLIENLHNSSSFLYLSSLKNDDVKKQYRNLKIAEKILKELKYHKEWIDDLYSFVI